MNNLNSVKEHGGASFKICTAPHAVCNICKYNIQRIKAKSMSEANRSSFIIMNVTRVGKREK